MNKKILLWIGMFIISINLAVAQTGLFTSDTAGKFAVTGIVVIVAILVLKEFGQRIFKKR